MTFRFRKQLSTDKTKFDKYTAKNKQKNNDNQNTFPSFYTKTDSYNNDLSHNFSMVSRHSKCDVCLSV